MVNPSLALQILKRRYTRASWVRNGVVRGKVLKANFNFDFSLSPMVAFMYTGSYEVETYLALERILKAGDTFIDVGANIGYISAMGMSLVGEQGKVIAFEPITSYFERLQELKSMNPAYEFEPVKAAAGLEDGKATIIVNKSDNIGNNSLLEEAMPESSRGEELEIEVIDLGKYLKEHKLKPRLIKIDTEGYELNVLRSLIAFIKDLEIKERPFILCEVTPEVYPKIGESIASLEEIIDEIQYSSHLLEGSSNEIRVPTLKSRVDVLFKPKKQ